MRKRLLKLGEGTMTEERQGLNLTLWGHSLQDYQEMFDISERELDRKKILDCCSGPASFNAEMQEKERDVVSCDELYGLDRVDMENYIVDVFQSMLVRISAHQDCFTWDKITSSDELTQLRQRGINKFLEDFSEGVSAGRYSTEGVTQLPFKDFSFDMALCPHYLFGNRSEQELEFHMAAILEMSRVANEVRIFPLITSAGEISPLLGPVMLQLEQQNFGVEVREVSFSFRKNANAMLRVWAQECVLAD